ncbi:MAG: hypothetical protein QI223_09190 [Candidatus Korarchaeota archaeon]|nr:hypothetical protein [Candidatus Korarchaeota archaeon]
MSKPDSWNLRDRVEEFIEDVEESLEDAWYAFKSYAEMTDLGEVARRYAVTNSFDGLLTVLGVVVGSYVYGVADPKTVISAGVGAVVGIALSAAVGTYITEIAERSQEIREMEAAVFTSLRKSVVAKAHRISAVVISLASSLVPASFTTLALSPFFMAARGTMTVHLAFLSSVGLILGSLFVLGAYLGRLSGGRVLFYGLVEVGVGVLIVAVLLAIGATP